MATTVLTDHVHCVFREWIHFHHGSIRSIVASFLLQYPCATLSLRTCKTRSSVATACAAIRPKRFASDCVMVSSKSESTPLTILTQCLTLVVTFELLMFPPGVFLFVLGIVIGYHRIKQLYHILRSLTTNYF